MKVSHWVWIIACSLLLGTLAQPEAFAQKRKGGPKSKDVDPMEEAGDFPGDGSPVELFPEGPETEEPESPLDAKVREAQDAYDEGRFEDCIQITSDVLRVEPKHSVARYHRASALIDLGKQNRDLEKVRAGISDARQALGIAGKQYLIFHVPYFYGLITLAEMENRPSHAELALKVATPLLARPDLPQDVEGLVYFQRGLARNYLKDYLGAAADFGAAIKIDAEFQAAYFNRADAFVKAGQPSKARECFDIAARLMSDDPLVFNNRGTFHMQQGRPVDAIRDFSRALELDDSFAMAALNMGYAQAQLKDWSAAENSYRLSLKLDDQQTLGWKLLGAALVAQGRFDDGLKAYTNALSLDPRDADSYGSRGFGRFFAKDYAGAAADFDQALRLSPASTLFVPWRYWSRVRQGQADLARKEMTTFIASYEGTPNWHVTLGQYVLGKLDDEALLKFVNDRADTKGKVQWMCEAYYAIGLQAEMDQQPQRAQQAFEACLKTNQTQLTAYLGAKLALENK